MRARLAQLLRDARLPSITFHELRHTTASLLFSVGMHPKIVGELLGHTTIATTLDVYSHLMPNMQGAAIRALENLLAEE